MVEKKTTSRTPTLFAVRAICVCSAVLLGLLAARGAAPRISYIDRYSTNKIRIHFDTEPNRTYVLQYANSWSKNMAATNWSNLYTALSFPISSHYIILDDRTTPNRIYRLKVTP